MYNNNKVKEKAVSRRRPIKITTIGDGMVGKTCMLITYTTKEFPSEYVPTVFENYAGEICVDGQEFNITIWDTAGQEDYERLRPLCYPNTDCFLVCFAVNSINSYENIMTKWYPEVKYHCPSTPIILVGTKGDLRNVEILNAISFHDCKKLKKKIKAYEYVECSAKKCENLEEVFTQAIRAVLEKPSNEFCCVF